MILQVILACVICFAITAGAGKLLIPELVKLKAGQSIKEIGPTWHMTKQGTPTMGGLMFIIGIGITVVILGWKGMVQGDFTHIYVYLFALVFGVIGYIDDYQKVKHHRNTGLTAIQKFLLQLAAAVAFLCLLRAEGHLSPNLYIPFFNTYVVLNWVVYMILAAFIIVGTVNAVNITDGLDGLSTSVTIPVAAFFAVLGVVWKGFPQLGIFAAAMAGGLLAFLLYNHYPAKVFMGDTGSLFLGGAVAALAVKTGFSEAMDLEGYRLQLETATKDTQKASDIMSYAVALANKTPFEGGELVEGASKFEAMGMAAKKWLPLAGDMAAATNKDFDQATEALIDAQNGELERLKEFGITKAKILEQGEKMFAGVQLVNGQGQITNQEKFNEAMIALMQDRFAGGMEKQATTMKGLWSTVTGVTKSALANMVGITSDGSIRSGSALEMLKGKVEMLAGKLQQWQQDGTLDRLAQKLDKGLATAAKAVGTAFQWVQDHGDTIKRWVVGLGAALGMVKIAQFASGVISAVKTIKLFATAAGAILAANPVVLAIGAAIAAGALLIANWDKVKSWAANIRDQFAASFGGILMPWIIGIISSVAGLKTGMAMNIISCVGMLIFCIAVKRLKDE